MVSSERSEPSACWLFLTVRAAKPAVARAVDEARALEHGVHGLDLLGREDIADHDLHVLEPFKTTT